MMAGMLGAAKRRTSMVTLSRRMNAAPLQYRYHGLHISRWLSTSAAPVANAIATTHTAKVARWSARLAHDNTFLSYHRNAIIATVAGCALIRYRKDEDRPPLDGVALLAMGGLYMYVGSGLYIWQTIKMSAALNLNARVISWSVFNATWPTTLWTIMLQCLVDETPTWLLDGLRLFEHQLPTALKASLFLDPPALYPVCRLLRGLQSHEQARLQAVRATMMTWTRPTLSADGPLSKSDIAIIIERRLDRLAALQAKLDVLARSQRAVPTALTAPLLDTLYTEAKLLEKVLEIDMSQGDRNFVAWRVGIAFSAERRKLRDELEAVRALLRRIKAVKKLGSVGYVALASKGVVSQKKRDQIYNSDIE